MIIRANAIVAGYIRPLVDEPLIGVVLGRRNFDALLTLSGEFDGASTAGLRSAVDALPPSVVRVELYASYVTFIDCSALHVLLDLARQMRQRQGVVVTRDPSRPFRQLIELAGTTAVLGL